jgi:hypothetical protein
MQDSIIESKTIYYTLFMVFCWCGNIFFEEREKKKDSKSYLDSKSISNRIPTWPPTSDLGSGG